MVSQQVQIGHKTNLNFYLNPIKTGYLGRSTWASFIYTGTIFPPSFFALPSCFWSQVPPNSVCTNDKVSTSLKEKKTDFYYNLIVSADLDRLNVVYSDGCSYLLPVNLQVYFLLCFHNDIKVFPSQLFWPELDFHLWSFYVCLFWLQVCLQLGKKASPILPVKENCALTGPWVKSYLPACFWCSIFIFWEHSAQPYLLAWLSIMPQSFFVYFSLGHC